MAEGVPRPPPTPTRTARVYPCCADNDRASSSIIGKRTGSGRLSVCPPESASTVTSSATGTERANSASSGVSLPSSTNAASMFSGAGERKGRATSTREIFAKMWVRLRIDPSAARFSPLAERYTIAGCNRMKADAEMLETPLVSINSAKSISM